MKTLIQWTHAHPLKAIGFAVLFTYIATFAGFRDDLLWPCIGVFSIVLGVFSIVFVLDHKVMVLLCACLLAPNLQAGESEPQPNGAAACAVVVIVVGGVIIYQLTKFCQKHFPKTPPQTNNFNGVVLESEAAGSAAASYNFSSCGSCDSPTLRSLGSYVVTNTVPTTFEITGTVRDDGQGNGAYVVLDPPRLAQDQGATLFSEYRAAVQSYGIDVSEHGNGEIYYGKDGQRADQESTGIYINTYDRSITVADDPTYNPNVATVVIERSTDMVNWTVMLNTRIAPGYKFKVMDTSLAGQVFYRAHH
jgi:hypothetical protein